MLTILLWAAIAFAAIKIAATVWLVRQPDATKLTDTVRGRAIYFAGKVTPALFVAVMLARGWIEGAPPAYLVFCVIALVAAIVMAIVVVRQRAAGKWYGLAHDIRQRRQH